MYLSHLNADPLVAV